MLAAAFRGDLTADWRKKNPNVEPASKLLERIRAERRKKWEEAELAKMKAKGKVPKDDKWKAKYAEPEPLDARELPELPPTWCWASLDDLLLSLRNGVATKPDRDDGLPVLRISAVRPLEVDLSDVRYLRDTAEYDPYHLTEHDLLFTRYNGNAELVGSCAVVTGLNRRIVFPDKLIRGRAVGQLVLPEFIAQAASAGATRAFIASKSKSAAGQVGISGSDLRRAPVPLVPVGEQKEIGRVVGHALTVSRCAQVDADSGLDKHASLERALLARAFAGQLV